MEFPTERLISWVLILGNCHDDQSTLLGSGIHLRRLIAEEGPGYFEAGLLLGHVELSLNGWDPEWSAWQASELLLSRETMCSST